MNVLLFSGAACFTYWLRSGEFFAPAREGYLNSLAQAFGGVGQPDISLAAFLVEPISIHDVPMQVPIVGLLMAALISIPILVAILYRFWASIPFVLIIGFIAVMPWLAITLLASCVVASVRPFRTRINFMSAMLALLPVLLYLILAYSGTRDVVVGRIDPVDRVKFVAPWVMAVVASAVVFAIVLTIARLVNYRPGAVTPLLMIMFAAPVIMFERNVGRDELYYRLLERMDREYFSDWNAGQGLATSQQDVFLRSQPPPAPSHRAAEEESWVFELVADLSPRRQLHAQRQAEIARRCDWFEHHFPYSPYAANVLFIKARAGDYRLDVQEFRRTRWVRFYDDFPNVDERQTWQIIAENRPGSPMGATALLRLSQLDARECDVDRAVERLRRLLEDYDHRTVAAPEEAIIQTFLVRRPPESGLGIDLDSVLLDASKLRDLLTANAADEAYRSDPLCGVQHGRDGAPYGLLDLDSREDGYAQRLEALLAAYPHCKLADNIELEVALSSPSIESRLEALVAVLEKYPGGDAAPQAMVALALAYKHRQDFARAEEMLRRLVNQHPDSIWARQCAELRLLPAALQGNLSSL